MKGIIVEIKGKYAVALTGNGSFVKIKSHKGYRVGEEASFTPSFQVNTHVLARAASIAAVFIFAFGISWGVYAMPYSYVDVDINPSVELTSNIFDRIIKVEALNSDGEKITEELKLNNKKLVEAISLLLDEAVENGYIEEGDLEAVMFSVTASDKTKSKKLENKLKAKVEKEFSKDVENSVVMVEKYTVEKQKAAKDKGISPGKLSLIEKLIEQNPEMNVDKLKDEPVKEIVKSLKQEKQEDKDKDNNKDKSKVNNKDKEKNQNSRGNSSSGKNDKANNSNDNSNNGKDKVTDGSGNSTADKAADNTANNVDETTKSTNGQQGKAHGNNKADN